MDSLSSDDEQTPDTSVTFFFDLAGRIRNLSLPASSANALIPLFEAVSNSLHAIEARFGDNAPEQGKIKIDVLRRDDKKDAHVVGFAVSDNGVGLTDENMRSFRTSDSAYKITKGGKGVGRLTWLKAFENCEIRSTFLTEGGRQTRSFRFSLAHTTPISDHVIASASEDAALGTEVRLSPFQTNYESYCPKKFSTIAAKLVGHFLNLFAVGNLPSIILADVDETSDLRLYYSENQAKNDVDILRIKIDDLAEPYEFDIFHVLLKKQLRFQDSGGLHWMFQAGNGRVAKQEAIDGQLGLKYVGDDADCVYVGLISGPFLDTHVNQERTGFTFSDSQASEIHKAAIDSAKKFLGEYINRIRISQVVATDKIIRENPQFLPFREGLEEFVASNLSLNTQSEEDIFLELSRRKLRAKRKLNTEIRTLKREGVPSVDDRVQRITKALNDEKKSSLAEYVVRRKEILELLDSSLAFESEEGKKHYKEEFIHKLIVPIRSSSEDLDYDQHNLWILDDRLAFYTFFRLTCP